MNVKAALAILILSVTPALAQQGSPTEQALGLKLMQEIQGGLTCSASLITVQAELAKAKEQIKKQLPADASPPAAQQ